MTGFWQSLTPRGRGFLTAGVAALLCGMVLGERDLVAIGAVLAILPILAAAWINHGSPDVVVTRLPQRQQVETGSPVEVELQVMPGPTSAGAILLHESVPYALGSSPRLVVGPAAGRGPMVATYTVRSELRGRHTLGPATIITSDPFGLVSRRTELTGTAGIVVTPRPEALPGMPVFGDGQAVGDFHPRSFIGGDATDVTVRDYRRGDDLRRVHWPSTAHAGTLMVRREEKPRQTSCTVLLDNRICAHRGLGSRSSLEYAVRAAASISLHLMGQGCQVQVYDAGGLALLSEGRYEQPGSAADELLSALAVLPGSGHEHLANEWNADAAGGFAVAVLGELDTHDESLLARLGRQPGARLALTLDVDSWAGAAPPSTSPDATTVRLQTAGWRAVRLQDGTGLPHAWRGLTR